MATRYARFTRDFYILLKYKVFLLFAMLLFTQLTVAEEDPYLSAISSEAEKVESSKAATSSEDEAADADIGPSMKAFEDDLKASYMGSYTFYQRLPRRSREEVFEEYKGGASIDEIRRKIMDRFLNR